MKLQDTAESTNVDPISGSSNPGNTNIVFSATDVRLNQWTGGKPPEQPYFAGTGNSVDIQISYQ